MLKLHVQNLLSQKAGDERKYLQNIMINTNRIEKYQMVQYTLISILMDISKYTNNGRIDR